MMNLSSRKKAVFLTVASNLLLQIVTALCGFVLPPLVIGTFGSSVNGMVSSISQFIAYLNIVEAGVGGAAIAALYKPLALGDTEERNAILSATARFYNRSGVLFTVLIFALAFVYPLIVGGEVDRVQSALMVLVLGITGAAEFFLIGKYRVLLTADKKVYVISLVQMSAFVLSTVLSVVLIKTRFGIVLVKFVSAIVYLARYLVLSLYVHKKYSDVDFHAESDTKAISQSKNVLVHQIGGLVVFNLPLVLITIFCSLKDASVYMVYAMVFGMVSKLLDAFGDGITAFFGESIVKDSLERTRLLFGRYETVYFALEGWFYGMTFLLALPFLQLYTEKMTDAQYIQPALIALFIAEGVLKNLRQPGVQLVSAAGHYKQTQKQLLIEVGLRFVFSLVCTIRFGMIGVLLGSLVSYTYRAVALTVYPAIHILKKVPILSFVKMATVFLLFFICVYAVRQIEVEITSYLAWLMHAVMYALMLAVPVGLCVGCRFLFGGKKWI